MGMLGKTLRVKQLFSSLRSDRRGGVALMAGLSFPMVFLGAGGAVDYTNALTATQKAQRALDSTVLALTRLDLTSVDVQAEGENRFRSLLENQRQKTDVSDVRFSVTDNVVRGEGLVGSKTFFLPIIGIDSVEGRVSSSAVPPANRPIEIALVLDVSGSMSYDLNGQTRLRRLKDAVGDMFDTLDEELPTGAKVSASLVPYSTSVNLGDFPAVLKAVSIRGKGKPPKGGDVWAAERAIVANGTDITLNDSSPVGRPIPFVSEAEISSTTPTSRLQPLNDDLAKIRGSVETMTANGWTAGHIGMVWGLYTLSENWKTIWPQAPAAKGDADKIIVMLSDGEFNTTHNIGLGTTKDGATSDAYFQRVCDLAVKEDVTIYTVALALDPVSEQKLRDCVGSTGKFYSADSGDDLSEAFKDIARRLGTHRLTS